MQWVAHTSAEGRPYWFNAGTNKSVWEKPDELKTPLELQLSQLAWKEYETGGRKYWVHNTSKETTWECPPEITAFLAKAIPTGPAADTPKATLPPAHPSLPLTPSSGALVAPGGYMPGLPSRPVPLTSQYLPDLNIRDAEGAFVDMLRRVGVTPKWTWEQTMREIITEPMYKALKTLAERKAAFEKFVADTIADEAATRQRSLDKNRKQFFSALNKLGGGVDREGGVKTWWNWDVRKEELEAKIPDAWKGLRNDEERRTLFSEFIANTKEKDLTRKNEARARNVAKLAAVLQGLSLDLAGTIRWKDAQEAIAQTPEWRTDTELQRIDPIDVIMLFEEEVRKAEKELHDARHKASEEKRRRHRKTREAYVALINSLIAAGQVTVGSKWKSVYPLLEPTDEYQNLLGIPGSSPLDLFWDALYALEMRAEADQYVVEKIVVEKLSVVAEDMNYDHFVLALAGDERLAEVDYAVIKAVYDKLHARTVWQNKDDRRRAEKRLRVLIDDLRYAFKKLDPPVDLDARFEDVLPRIEATPEFKALDDEADRKTAFDKFVKRQREKLHEQQYDQQAGAEHESESGRQTHREPDRNRKRERDGASKSSAREAADSAAKRSAAVSEPGDMAMPVRGASNAPSEVEEGEIA